MAKDEPRFDCEVPAINGRGYSQQSASQSAMKKEIVIPLLFGCFWAGITKRGGEVLGGRQPLPIAGYSTLEGSEKEISELRKFIFKVFKDWISDICEMKLDRYELKSDDPLSTYEFLSEGPKGKIPKIVQFTLVNQIGLYNLGFGDKDPFTGSLMDDINSGNGDTEKVLATVVSAVYAFCDRVPDAWIYATGSTLSRTRLYRMGINKFYDLVDEDFEIFGQTEGEWEGYAKGYDYQAFVVKRKKTVI